MFIRTTHLSSSCRGWPGGAGRPRRVRTDPLSPSPSGRRMRPMSQSKRAAAEFLGTFWLVFGGCGSAVLSAAFPHVGIGLLGVSLAFGLTVLTMAYAIGHVSGCHLNPAVSIGLTIAGRFRARDLPAYVLAQV